MRNIGLIGSGISVLGAAFGCLLLQTNESPGQQYSTVQCRQLLAQIQADQRVLPAYQSRGLGGMIQQGISANQAEYNRGCRGGQGLPMTGPQVNVPASSGAGDRVKDELGGMNLDEPKQCDAVAQVNSIDFDREWQAAIGKVKAYRDLKETLAKLRADLQSDRFWVGEWRQEILALLQTAKTSGELFLNLAGIGAAECAGKEAIVTAGGAFGEQIFGETGDAVYNAAKSKRNVRPAVMKGIKDLGQKAVIEVAKCVKKIAPVSRTLGTIYDFVQGMREMVKNQVEFEATRKEVAEQISKLDDQIRDVDTKLTNAENWAELKSKALDGARRACQEQSTAGTQLRLP